MNVILKQDQFNASNMFWEFYLIGNDFDKTNYIEDQLENGQVYGERSVVFKTRHYKIFVKKWSEIFTEFELRHKFLNDKLMIEKNHLINESESANGIISNIENNVTCLSPQMDLPR